jgi:hypothetical protein
MAAFFASVMVAACLQHAHYHSMRREAAQDRQPMLYDRETFHVLTFVRTRMGEDLINPLKGLYEATEEGMWVYAGKAIFTMPSAQIGPTQWSGVVLTQYPSRSAYEAERATLVYEEALRAFVEHYEQGMRRSALANLLIPQVLLVKKGIRAARFTKSPYPFTPARESMPGEIAQRISENVLPRRAKHGLEMMARLRAEGQPGKPAVVVVNINKRGTPEQVARDKRYTNAMLGLMAEHGYGPLHHGDAEPLSGDHDFDSVTLVYYPGTLFFADMISSTFFQSILSDKQLGDNQSTVTIPVLELVAS